jgi:hypothetical protein
VPAGGCPARGHRHLSFNRRRHRSLLIPIERGEKVVAAWYGGAAVRHWLPTCTARQPSTGMVAGSAARTRFSDAFVHARLLAGFRNAKEGITPTGSGSGDSHA